MSDNKTIYIYGDNIGKVELVDHMGTDLTIVNSARVSFNVHKEEMDDKDVKLISYLIKHRHTSTLEHCVATFRFKVPLYIRSQHHRHRTWSFNEISRRYTAENLEFYEPKEFRTQHKSNRQASNPAELINPMVDSTDCDVNGKKLYNPIPVDADQVIKQHHRRSVNLYNDLMEAGVCREQARGVLPQNLYTEYYGTIDLNNLLKFIDLRSHAGAQWEINRVADACLEIAQHLWPVTVEAYRQIRNKE